MNASKIAVGLLSMALVLGMCRPPARAQTSKAPTATTPRSSGKRAVAGSPPSPRSAPRSKRRTRAPLPKCPAVARLSRRGQDYLCRKRAARIVGRRIVRTWVSHGPWQRREKDGSLAWQGYFRNGRRHGKWIQWVEWPKYKLRSMSYLNGKLHGRWFRNYGTIQVTKHYRRGILHGRYLHELGDADADRTIQGVYRNGKRHGRWTKTVDGRIVSDCSYRAGRKIRCRVGRPVVVDKDG